MKLSRDAWLGLVGAAGGIVLYLMGRSIDDWAFDVLGASFFPKLAAVLMFVFGLMLFFTSLPEGKNSASTKPSSKPPQVLYINLLFIAILILYVAILPYAGFISSSICLILIMYFNTVRKFDFLEIAKGLSFAVLSVLLIWVVFTKEFELLLP